MITLLGPQVVAKVVPYGTLSLFPPGAVSSAYKPTNNYAMISLGEANRNGGKTLCLRVLQTPGGGSVDHIPGAVLNRAGIDQTAA
jgi:hypothetical protein